MTYLGSDFHKLHAVQVNEPFLAFFVFSVIGKIGILHLHPCLTCMLKVNPFYFDMFGTNSSFILYMYINMNLSYPRCILYIGFLACFQKFSIV